MVMVISEQPRVRVLVLDVEIGVLYDDKVHVLPNTDRHEGERIEGEHGEEVVLWCGALES